MLPSKVGPPDVAICAETEPKEAGAGAVVEPATPVSKTSGGGAAGLPATSAMLPDDPTKEGLVPPLPPPPPPPLEQAAANAQLMTAAYQMTWEFRSRSIGPFTQTLRSAQDGGCS